MTASLLHRRDHVVRTRPPDDVLVVEVPHPRHAARAAVAAAVVAVVATGAVTWDGSGPGVAGVVDSGTGTQGPVPHPQPGPVARPDR